MSFPGNFGEGRNGESGFRCYYILYRRALRCYRYVMQGPLLGAWMTGIEILVLHRLGWVWLLHKALWSLYTVVSGQHSRTIPGKLIDKEEGKVSLKGNLHPSRRPPPYRETPYDWRNYFLPGRTRSNKQFKINLES